MAVSAKKLVADFKRKKNLGDEAAGETVILTTIISCLNEAYKIWYDHTIRRAEEDSSVRSELLIFKKDQISLTLSKIDDNITLAKYPVDLYKRLDQIAITSCDCCPGFSKNIIPRIVTSDELYEARRNPLRKADYYFEQLIATEGNGGLMLYHDGAMKIDKVIIDYYRIPAEGHCPSLEKCDGEYYYDYDGRIITKDVDFEFAPNSISDLLVSDLAVAISERDVKDVKAFQTQMAYILGVKDFYKE